jgi:DNA-binding SARP family transcriptional activator/tetratricopeptide (TPR) repeat protein
VELRLLGPVEVRAAGRLVDAGGARQRGVLAALAVDAGRPVPVETVVDRVWDDLAPARARHALHVYIARLRKVIDRAGDTGADRLVHRSQGYVLDVDPDIIDIHRFRGLVDLASDRNCPDTERTALLRQALDLWRGAPLADLPGEWAGRVRETWRQQRLDAIVLWAQAGLRQGNAATITAELTAMTVEYPLAEPLLALWMRALHAAGRSAEAIEGYARIRRRLVEELGTEPGAELQALHQAILRGGLDIPASTSAPARAARTVPAQLPPDVPGLAGRFEQLKELDTLLPTEYQNPGAVVITAIAGTAGVGKTALAIHWAHQVRDQFPDGQLYVNLRGFDPTGSAISPADAVRGFLDALDVPPQRVPTTFEAQVGLYRSLLAGRRVLVVLDNARNAEHVRPLLPGASGCLAVVTSRNQLTGLAATEGARLLVLDLLTAAEARDLLLNRLGPERVTAERQAVKEIITWCSRLPLALAIVAARAAAHPRIPLTALAAELRRAHGSLDAFSGDDLATNVRAVFSWSYQTLSPAAARLFRLLGLHSGPDIAMPAAASLAGVPPRQVRPLLAELVDAHLITEHVHGRYAFHDLLRAYATELANSAGTDIERHAAVHRVLDHYLHSASAADQVLYPDPLPLPPHQPGTTPEQPADHEQAMAWLTAEQAVLVSAVDQAAQAGLDIHAWQLAWSLVDFLDRRGHWHELAAVQKVALGAAQRLADRSAQARAHRGLGRAYTLLGRHNDAREQYGHALKLLDELGDGFSEAHVHRSLARLHEWQHNYAGALGHARKALDLFRAAGHPTGEGNALNNVGWLHALLDNHEQAIAYCTEALAMHEDSGNRHGAAAALDSLGYSHHRLGHHEQAIDYFRAAITLFEQLGDRYNQADVLTHLGDAHDAAGETNAARRSWQQALGILDELGHTDADRVRAQLSQRAIQPEGRHLL